MQQTPDITQFIPNLNSYMGDQLEDPIKILAPNLIRFSTMEEEPTIIKSLYTYFESQNMHIQEFTMHSKMIQDEDDNFITTLTFSFESIL